jgi:hypothetical protein
VYDEWRDDLLARNERAGVPTCAGPTCAPLPEFNPTNLFPCSAADIVGVPSGPDATAAPSLGETCPLLPNSNLLLMRSRLASAAPLVCAADENAECCQFAPAVAQVSINALHASVCPGAPNCRPTVEQTVQSNQDDPLLRTQLAIAEANAFQQEEIARANADARAIEAQYQQQQQQQQRQARSSGGVAASALVLSSSHAHGSPPAVTAAGLLSADEARHFAERQAMQPQANRHH